MLGGAPRLGRVTQPGLRNRTPPRLSLRGTCVCPCRRTLTSSGGRSGGTCCRRNFNPPRARSRTNGHSKLLSQFPRTTVTRGPIARSSSRTLSAQTSPRCQISSASLAISFTFSGRRSCVSARTKMRTISFGRSWLVILEQLCPLPCHLRPCPGHIDLWSSGCYVAPRPPAMSQNYKEALNLPRTEFPMKANLTGREPEMLKMWEETRLYQQIQKSRADRELFVLHDGPPFANGDVHMGTALNKILKDFVVKSQTMLGKRAPYVPGWDCHGLPIEYKVVKESRALSPLEVRQKCEAFARKFINIQREQFKRLGVFGDWEHPYLTMDPRYEGEILRAFAVFVEEGLVYQAQKPVFWSTGAQTALAEAEVEYQERDDTAVYVRFPLPHDQLVKIGLPTDKPVSVAIWTTTPWTLPANLAIAVDPDAEYEILANQDEGVIVARKLREQFIQQTGFVATEESTFRVGKQLVGLQAQHPFLDRKSTILAADFVTMDTGTGLVHIAPGHGEDDYWLGRANGLEILSPVDDHGRFTD